MPRYIPLCLILAMAGCATNHAVFGRAPRSVVDIGPFNHLAPALHQPRIQKAFDAAGDARTIFRFAPGDYALTEAQGIRVPSGATLLMDNARFLLSKDLASDGQAFLLDRIANVSITGGEIVGARAAWSPGTNIAGIRVLGPASGLRIQGLTCRDLSSNGIGVFGKDDAPIRDVSLTDVTVMNCCNDYADYLEPNRGPAPGSLREDQGSVAFYYVDGWSVDSCRFQGSHSDGTHFFHSNNGRFNNSTVEGSKMGGYFLEGCENVIATGNLFRENGSRGVTIERDSRNCTLASSLIEHSGREGLWMPDVASIIVTGNLFIENGRKDDAEKDCEIRLDDTNEFPTQTQDVRIEGNQFKTSPHQTAVVYQGPGVTHVEIDNNTYQGEAPQHN